jgi:chromate transport protein ChrA
MKQARPFLISAAITALVMVVLSFFIDDDMQAKGALVTGLIVAITIAAIPIYDIDRWSLAKRSVVHFLAMLVTVFPLLLISEWFSVPVSILVFLLFGVAGWTIGYIVNRVQEKRK